MCNLALSAVRTVVMEIETGNGSTKREIDIKRYARVEKVPGGEIEESCVLDGIMINKDVTHPKMSKRGWEEETNGEEGLKEVEGFFVGRKYFMV